MLGEIKRFVSSLPLPAPELPAPARPRRGADPLDILTAKQREVLELVAQGRSNKEIAALLGISAHTVHRHIADLLGRLGVSTRAAAAALFAERLPPR